MIKNATREAFEKDLLEFDQSMITRCNGRMQRCGDDAWNQTYGFSRPQFEDVENDESKLTIPYDASEISLRKVRNAGRWLATQPTIIGITSKFISFVVGRGHMYDIKPVRQFIGDDQAPNASKIKQAEQLTLNLKFALYDEVDGIGWYEIQKETLERLVEDGEVFRRLWSVNGTWDVTFMEPETIKNPGDIKEIVNLDEVPPAVMELIDRGTPIWGMHGIITDPMDVRDVLGYWRLIGKNNHGNIFQFLPASPDIQHIKNGVKRNDPRGVPMFYWAIPNSTAENEVDGSMVDLALVQAKHAVLYNYKDSHLSAQIQNIAKGRQDIAEKNRGRPMGPGETDTKGANVEVTQLGKNAGDSIEIIQQEQRYQGNMIDMPEFMSTADANTGGRSNLISAEGPFDRRTQREQIRMFSFDAVFFRVILSGEDAYDPREFNTIPLFPVAATRDKAKEIESEVLLVESELQSEDMARDHLKLPKERAKIEINQQTRPTLREKMNAKETQTGAVGNTGTGDSPRPTQGRRGARSDT